MDVHAASQRPAVANRPCQGPGQGLISRELVGIELSAGCTLRRRNGRQAGGGGGLSEPAQERRVIHLRPSSPPLGSAAPGPCEPSPVTHSLSLGQSGGQAFNRLISDIAWRVLVDALDQLFFEAEPVTHDFKEVYVECRCILDGNLTRQETLHKLSVELTRFASRLANYSGRLTPYWRQLRTCLGTVGPWLSSLSKQWLTLELLVEQCTAQQEFLKQAADLSVLARRFLTDPQLQVLVGKGLVGQLDQRLESIDQLLTHARLWQALPGSAGLGDYVQLLAGNPLLGEALADSLQQLGRGLGQVHKGYPDKGTLPEKLVWLLVTLGDPALRDLLQGPLERLLGSRLRVEQLFSLCQVVESLRLFPVQGTLVDQTLCLLALLKHNVGDDEAYAWLTSCHGVLGADPATLSLVNRLLSLRQSRDGGLLLLKDLLAALALPVAHLVAGQTLPAYAVQGLRALQTLYRQGTPDESWPSLARRIAQSVMEIARPYALGALMGHPLAAATVRYAEALKTHTGWEQSCQWFVAHAPAGDLALQLAYGQYLNALLVWQVYQACAGGDPLQTEDRLRQLARQLKEYQVVKSYPQLEPLIDLLPLLPLLMEARRSVSVQLNADSWLGWGSQWLNALASSASSQRSAMDLHRRLSRQVEHWLADALVAAMSKFPMGPPGAAAVSTSGAVGRPFKLLSAGLGSHGLLLAGISLEAVALGAIGYAVWQAREAGNAGAPLAEAETGLMGGAARTGGRGLQDHKASLLLGLAAMATGGFLLYRWAYSEAPADRCMETGDARETDFDLPVYTPYVNALLACALEVVEGSPTAPLARRLGRDTSALADFPRRSERVKRVVVSQDGQTASLTYSDPVVQLARRALDFSKNDNLVASELNRLWHNSITLNHDSSLNIEQKKNLYLTQFHHALIQQVALILPTLDNLKKAGAGIHSEYHKSVVWMASLAAAAEEVQQHSSTANTRYWQDWRHDSRRETLSLLNRAFRIEQREADTYFQQRQARIQPSDTDYLQAPDLSNTQKLWRSALVVEQREFEELIDKYVGLKKFEALPDLFINVLKLRMELLGVKLYESLKEGDKTGSTLLQRTVDVETLEMRKIHLANAFIEEVDSYAICKQLRNLGPLRKKYSKTQAVFEAKKIAVELVLEKFSVDVASLDDDDKVMGFYQISREDGVSDQVKAYLNKAGALAFFMMTNDVQAREYKRWTNALSVSFAEASTPTEYFKRLYEDRPAGYRSLDTFKKSSESETWVDYYDQFIQYREKYIDFDARQMSYGAMANQGLTDYRLSQLQAEKIVYADLVVYSNASTQIDELLNSGAARDLGDKFHNMLNGPTEVPGTIGFIALANGGILALAGLDFNVTVKLFEPSSVSASQVLSKIHSLMAIPYRGTVGELEGRKLIDDVLRPMGLETDALIGKSGYPILKAPRKFRGWWERNHLERQHPRQGQPLMNVADEVMRENLSQWVGLLKTAHKDNDFWGVVLGFLPLYTELRDVYADADHRLDGNGIMWDVLGIVLSIMPALGAMTQLGRTTFKILLNEGMHGLAAGRSFKVVTRQILLGLMTNPEFAGLGLKGFTYAAYIGFDVVSPLPAELCVKGIMRASKHIRAYIQYAYATADSVISTLNVLPSDSLSTLPTQVQAELTALAATTRVLIGPHKIIVLRNSSLTPPEVIAEGLALAAPLDRKLPVMKRIENRTQYSIDHRLCAPVTRRQIRSLEYKCLDDLDYLDAKNVIEAGDGYTVYKLSNSQDSYVVREFRSERDGDQSLRIRKASNNSLAYNRIYGGPETGKAQVLYFPGEGPVVTLLPSSSGKTLSAILAEDDRTAMEGVRILDRSLVVEGLVSLLRDMGVYYRAVNFSGVVYDSVTRTVRLNNFDYAVINEPGEIDDTSWEVLTTAQIGALTARFTQVFNDFIRQTKALRPNDVGLNTSVLTLEQLAELDTKRERYEHHAKVMASGKRAADFNFAKRHHQGFEVAGVKKTDSELVLITRYNEWCGTADVMQLGALSGKIENTRSHRIIHSSIYVAAKYAKPLKNGSYRQIIAPQSFWLCAADAPRTGEGRCYPLVMAAAVAVIEYSAENFFMNIMRSAAKTDHSHNEIIRAIDQIRKLDVNDFIIPKLNAAPSSVGKILTYLSTFKENSMFAMDSQKHSMLIGVTFDIFGENNFYFYDPNIGFFVYPSIDLLATAMHGTIGTVSLAAQYCAWNLPKSPKYKLALINTENLKGKTLEVPPAEGPGFRPRTVGELSSSLDSLANCLPRSLSRHKRAPGCTPIESDIILMQQTQEALFNETAVAEGSYQRALDFAIRLRDDYHNLFMQGLDLEREFTFLELTRQQLIGMDEVAIALTGAGTAIAIASPDPVERQMAYFNYLTALITVAHRIDRFAKGHRD